jgi:putative acetyltransferase
MSDGERAPGSPFSVRPEQPADFAAIDRVVSRAFARPQEAELVRALRASAQPYVGWVAERAGEILGHIAFSPVSTSSAAALAMGLGPLAAAPEAQRSGVGSALVRRGLADCAARSAALVFVLGHPEYYPRFGFRPAAALGFHFRSPGFEPSFFVLELVAGAAQGLSGRVEYHEAFDRV